VYEENIHIHHMGRSKEQKNRQTDRNTNRGKWKGQREERDGN